ETSAPAGTTEQRLREALALWRGPALEGMGHLGPVTSGIEQRLGEERAVVQLRLIDLLLAGGRYDDVLPELRELSVAHPVDERYQERLMRALSLSGRQTEAVDVYHLVREELRRTYGLEPGPLLRRRLSLVLRQEV
ncbi:hypothetical protein EF919_38195, partial [Streptomyces sp. WAC02707]|uniref:AfsR/SARP family transcriptional regulator n=1 Tax=Streptomyces sp. WAC02707 TaxID=2487417 RepID=UPI000FAE41AA